MKIDVTPIGYGRISAQSAKQALFSDYRKLEREIMYQTFKDRENELLNALVHRVERNQVYVDLITLQLFLRRISRFRREIFWRTENKIYLDKVI